MKSLIVRCGRGRYGCAISLIKHQFILRSQRYDFATRVDSVTTPQENSNLFFARAKSTEEFIAKLKSKAKKDRLDDREKEITEKLSKSDVWEDSKIATELSQELAGIKERQSEITSLELSLSDVVEMYDMAVQEVVDGSQDKDIIQECFETLQLIETEIEKRQVKELMVGKYDDAGSCFLQINAGAGGTEACDWVGMILKLYKEYCKLNGFALNVVDEHVNEEMSNIGYRSVTIRVKGKNAYFWMKSEAGVHRLVRVSPFDPSKKRHTTFAQVLVYPELEENNDISKEDILKDVRMDTYRSSGAGGQSVQKTDSAVRLTHIPSGLVVTCQNERSQHQNKATALSILQSRLRQVNKEKSYDLKAQVTIGTGDNSWGNQIRSVVMQPYQMVKDHRTGWETGNVEGFMSGAVLGDSLISTLKHFADKNAEGA